MTERKPSANPVLQNPQSPVEAFESLVALVRGSSVLFTADPDLLFRHLAPFLANARRDEPYVREMMELIVASRTMRGLARAGFGPFINFFGRFATIEKLAPHILKRLENLEAALKTELQPGSLSIHIRPARFIERAKGFGSSQLSRYEIQIQTLVDTPKEDVLQALSVEVRVGADEEKIEVDDLSPKSAFSSVARKSAATSQIGMKRTGSATRTFGGELGGPGSKISSSSQISESLERSVSFSDTAEQTVARVEHYLVARKIANKAWWHALAGIGPIDAAGGEYRLECLVPGQVSEMHVMVEARVDWLRAGIVPARINQRVSLPTPDI